MHRGTGGYLCYVLFNSESRITPTDGRTVSEMDETLFHVIDRQ